MNLWIRWFCLVCLQMVPKCIVMKSVTYTLLIRSNQSRDWHTKGGTEKRLPHRGRKTVINSSTFDVDEKILQTRPCSRDQSVTQQSGRGCVRTLVPRVDSGCWHITDTCVYDHQLKSITCRCFQSQGSDSSNTWVSCTWWLADTRSGTVKSWGHGP